jgi:hypothetical protein
MSYNQKHFRCNTSNNKTSAQAFTPGKGPYRLNAKVLLTYPYTDEGVFNAVIFGMLKLEKRGNYSVITSLDPKHMKTQ